MRLASLLVCFVVGSTAACVNGNVTADAAVADGTPTACTGLGIPTPCIDQEGCTVTHFECEGVAVPCEDITDQTVCEHQRLCTWQ